MNLFHEIFVAAFIVALVYGGGELLKASFAPDNTPAPIAVRW